MKTLAALLLLTAPALADPLGDAKARMICGAYQNERLTAIEAKLDKILSMAPKMDSVSVAKPVIEKAAFNPPPKYTHIRHHRYRRRH